MEHFKWPPYNKDNYIEYDAKDPTLENGLVIKLEGKAKTKKKQNQGLKTESR